MANLFVFCLKIISESFESICCLYGKFFVFSVKKFLGDIIILKILIGGSEK